MAPGIDGLPAAERDIDVSGPVAAFIGSLSPSLLLRLRLGLRAFEWLPFPWRFSRLDPEAAEDFLRKLDSSRFPLHHDLLLMGKLFSTLGYAVAPEVEARIGTVTACALADGTLPEPAGSLGETEPRGEGEECDVVIVGSGAGGAVAAATLAEAGLDVLVLEAGDHYDRDSYPADRLEAIQTLYREAGLTIAEGRPPIPVPVAKVVGGTTVINSGTCFRAPDSILEEWRGEFGLDWAHDLDADYSEAEEFLRVTQLDPNRMGRNGQLAMEGAAALGFSGGPIHRNAGNCVQCSSCPYGCSIDAKRGMHVSYLPRAVAAGARLRTGVEAQRILVEDGRAVGVACSARDAAGRHRDFTVRARRAVIAAGGSLGTPELLLRSGLGGRQVGRNLRIHPACWVGARYEEEVRGWDGVMQSYYIDQWEEPQGVLLEATFTPLAFGGAWLVGTGREHQQAMLDFGRDRLDRRAAARQLGRRGRARQRRRPARQVPPQQRGCAQGELRDRPRGRNPLRRRRHRGLPEHPPRRGAAAGRSRNLRGHPLQTLRTAAGGLPPDGDGADLSGSAPRGMRCRRLGLRHRRPLRRRRLAVSDRRRRQPDDDHHRLREAGLPRNSY